MSKTPKPRAKRATKSAPRRSNNEKIAVAGVAIGIGSAAVAAALLYSGKLKPTKASAAEHGPGHDDTIEGRFVDET